MIYLPLFFLGFLLAIEYKKHGLSSYSYVLLVFFITAIGSVAIDSFGFYAGSAMKLPLGVFAPILYCLLMFISMQPFSSYRKLKIRRMDKLRGLNTIVVLYMAIFIIIFLVSYTRTNEVLASDDLRAVRYAQYAGEAESFYNHLSGFPRYVCAVCSILSPSTYIMVFLFIYSVTCLNNKWWYNLLILIPSFSPLLLSINIADRSQFVYWALVFGFSFSFFYNHMERKTRVLMINVVAVILGVFSIYFMAVTIARFGMRADGATGGMVLYLGQNYINFCNWLNYTEPGFIFDRIMPITAHYLYPIKPIMPKMSDPTILGYELNGFSTFLGGLYQSGGLAVMFIYLFVYRFMMNRVLNISLKQRILQYRYLLLIVGLSMVVVLGVFGHYYGNEDCEIGLFVWFLIGVYLDKKNRIKAVSQLDKSYVRDEEKNGRI